MRMRHVIAPLASVMAFCTACGSAPETVPMISMDPVATSGAPLTGINSIALADETTACVIESYEERIHCLGRDGQEVGAFGRPGEGPGEFRSLMEVVGGPNGTIGAIDWGLARMTVFEATGTRVSEVGLPFFGPYRATASFDSVLFGYGMANRSGDLSTGFQTLHTGLDLASGDILWERGYPVDLLETGATGAVERTQLGVPTPTGGIVFPACGGLMVFLEDRDGDDATLVEAPLYVEEFRTEAEVDAFAAQQRMSMFGSEAAVERYRTTPLRYNVDAPSSTTATDSGSSRVDFTTGSRIWTSTRIPGSSA